MFDIPLVFFGIWEGIIAKSVKLFLLIIDLILPLLFV